MTTDLNKALGLLGETVIGQGDWMRALDAVAEAMGACGVVLLPGVETAVPDHIKISASLKESAEAYIRERWYERDVRAIRGWPEAAHRKVIREQEISTPQERAQLPYYQDFLLKHDLEWWAGLVCEAEMPWCLSFQRTPRDEPFNDAEAAQLAAIAPHFATFIRLHDHMDFAERRPLLDAYEFIGKAAIVLSADQRVLGMTPRAEQEIAGAIIFRGGRLSAVDKTSDERLQELMHSATNSERLNALYGRVSVRKPGGGALIVEALPLPQNIGGGHARALLTVKDPYRAGAADADLLAQTFRFTPAQLRLTQALLEQGSVKAAADSLSISYETARGQLRDVFEKTDTSKQSELLRLLERFSREN